jgi:hypothetical protein
MALIIAFNAVLVLLAFLVAMGIVPMKPVSGLVAGFHATIGITPPTEKQLRWVIVAWIVSVLLIVDLVLLLFVYVF